MPPLSSSRTGPPQNSIGRPRGPQPRDCNIRPSKGGYHEAGHVDQLVDGYRPRLTPGNLVRILAKGQSSTDLIHTESTQVFRSFGHLLAHPQGGGRSSARPPPRPERAAARSARGRRPFKHGTVPPPAVLFEETATRGGEPKHPPHECRRPAGRTGEGTAGFVDSSTGELYGGDHHWHPTPVGPSVNGPGCFDGRGGCDRPRCPAGDY